VALTTGSFAEGGLPRESFVRPVKLFTANESIVVRPVGRLTARMHRMVVDAVVNVSQAALK
jgi:mRNA interferase MazF